MPSTPFMGVRISWLIIWSWDFAWFAASAPSFMSLGCASLLDLRQHAIEAINQRALPPMPCSGTRSESVDHANRSTALINRVSGLVTKAESAPSGTAVPMPRTSGPAPNKSQHLVHFAGSESAGIPPRHRQMSPAGPTTGTIAL
jgi:hypothetical protein